MFLFHLQFQHNEHHSSPNTFHAQESMISYKNKVAQIEESEEDDLLNDRKQQNIEEEN